jgi:hypothetical protein
VKVLLVVVMLAMFVLVPIGSACAEPFCDWALDSGKVVDWLVCQVFAMMLDLGSGDWQGNYTFPW